MQKPPHLPLGLTGLAVLATLWAGCGQNEGGRCQINSDCGSGLVCSEGTTGNGVCRPAGVPSTAADASLGTDVADDVTSVAGPEVAPAAVEVEPAEAQSTIPTSDTAAAASGAVDSGGVG